MALVFKSTIRLALCWCFVCFNFHSVLYYMCSHENNSLPESVWAVMGGSSIQMVDRVAEGPSLLSKLCSSGVIMADNCLLGSHICWPSFLWDALRVMEVRRSSRCWSKRNVGITPSKDNSCCQNNHVSVRVLGSRHTCRCTCVLMLYTLEYLYFKCLPVWINWNCHGTRLRG